MIESCPTYGSGTVREGGRERERDERERERERERETERETMNNP